MTPKSGITFTTSKYYCINLCIFVRILINFFVFNAAIITVIVFIVISRPLSYLFVRLFRNILLHILSGFYLWFLMTRLCQPYIHYTSDFTIHHTILQIHIYTNSVMNLGGSINSNKKSPSWYPERIKIFSILTTKLRYKGNEGKQIKLYSKKNINSLILLLWKYSMDFS